MLHRIEELLEEECDEAQFLVEACEILTQARSNMLTGPDRSALSAVKQVHSLLSTGHTSVIEGDLSGYFYSIPDAELLTSVARRVFDRDLLHLIKM